MNSLFTNLKNTRRDDKRALNAWSSYVEMNHVKAGAEISSRVIGIQIFNQ